MAKKKISQKSIYKTKLTKTQTIFSILFIIVLFTCLGLFFFSTDSGLHYRMLFYSRLLNTKNNYINYTLTLTPTPTRMPTPTHMVVPTYSYTNPSNGKLPDFNFDKLIVYQKNNDNVTLTKVITDLTIIKKLYSDINNLPFWIPGAKYHCPIDTGTMYILDFYSTDQVGVHSTLNPTGCPTVKFPSFAARMALSPQGKILFNDLQQNLNLSKEEFYGYSK